MDLNPASKVLRSDSLASVACPRSVSVSCHGALISLDCDRRETEEQVKDRWRRYWRKLWEGVEE
jgi:hypothetical protein